MGKSCEKKELDVDMQYTRESEVAICIKFVCVFPMLDRVLQFHCPFRKTCRLL